MNLRARKEYRLRANGEWGYYTYLLGICLMFLFRDVLQISVPLVLFLGYFAIGYMIFDYDHCLALSAMLPLLHHGVQTNYIILIAAVCYVFRFGVHIRLNITHGIVAFLMIYEMLHMVYQPFSFAETLRFTVQYAYIALVLGDERLPQLLKNPGVVVRTFIFMAAYFMLDVLLVTSRYIPLNTLLSSNFRFGTLDEFLYGSATLYDNENTVGLFALIAINLTVITLVKSRKMWLLKLLAMAYFMYFGLLTSSKTFLVCLIGTAALYGIYILYLSRKSVKRSFFIIIGMLIVVLLVTQVFFAEELERIVERFQAEDISTGRTRLFKIYNDYIVSDWRYLLFGIGLQYVSVKVNTFNTVHNAIQDVYVCWGIFGLLLVIIWLVDSFSRARRFAGGKIRFWYWIPLISYFVFIQTMQFVRLTSSYGLLTVLYIVLVYSGDFYEKENLLDNS